MSTKISRLRKIFFTVTLRGIFQPGRFVLNFANRCSFDKLHELQPCIALYGVYAGEKLIYVGTAWGLRRRLKSHHRMPEFLSHDATELRWNVYGNRDGVKLRDDEANAIAEFKPILNRAKGGRSIKKHDTSTSVRRKPRFNSVLHQKVYELLWETINSSLSKTQALDTIANETELNYYWLDCFARDIGGSPAVERLEKLYNHLSSRPLKV